MTVATTPPRAAADGWRTAAGLAAHAAQNLVPLIGPLIGPQTIVLTAMNGVPWWFFEGFGVVNKQAHNVEQAGKPGYYKNYMQCFKIFKRHSKFFF